MSNIIDQKANNLTEILYNKISYEKPSLSNIDMSQSIMSGFNSVEGNNGSPAFAE